jgi:crotonobetainyl-CoA:carnitine CoA-transferase CaiB-like acyl-CoA transferase
LQKHSHSLRSKPPLLLTESQSEFDDLEASRKEILPRGIVEQIYFDDIIASVWEILRLRRCKTTIVNIAFKKALRALLETLLNYNYSRAEDLAKRWFNDPAARTEVVEILGKFKLDESAIEAEAIRISSASLEGIDRMLAAAELRRSRAFRNIEDCRASFAKTIRTVSDRALQESTEPLTLQPQE